MKIKNLTITSPSTLDLELDITSPICVFHGGHSELAFDLYGRQPNRRKLCAEQP